MNYIYCHNLLLTGEAVKETIGNNIFFCSPFVYLYCKGLHNSYILVTPLDVVKIRLQAQHKQPVAGTSFVYNNGLMDHICAFRNGGSNGKMFVCTCTVDTTTVKREWFKGQKFHGTLVGN